ncbi:MAG: SDR family oxidoreductase [Gemmatimonadota bacterium]
MASSADLTGRRMLVTGATGGVGSAIARRLTEARAHLFLVARTRSRLEAVAEEVGGTPLVADAGDPEAAEEVRARLEPDGGVDVLVNAAGTFDLAPAADTDPDLLERMIHGNLRAPILMTGAVLPGMLERGHGHIVTIGSVAGRLALPGNAAYSASKFGIRGFHEVLAVELPGTGVRTTLVEPAATDTGIWDPLEPDDRDDLPGRAEMLDPDAVAEAVIFAISRPPDVNVPTVAVQRS